MSHPVVVLPPTVDDGHAYGVVVMRYPARLGCGCVGTVTVPVSRSNRGQPDVMAAAHAETLYVAQDLQCVGVHR